MPRRNDIHTILIIGSGPIVIGQGCEFDYSGVQACRALRQEGYRVVLVNSNPATIMTDPEVADATYVEPITPAFVRKIIEKERPDALLPTMGGQTALNVAKALAENGALAELGCELIGGIAYNREEFEQIVASGIDASPIGEVLIDESVLGWKEFEMEVVRDKADNCIIVCSIENVDPMGVHTGDSITVAPALTLTDKEYQIMRNASIAVLREIGVETGGAHLP